MGMWPASNEPPLLSPPAYRALISPLTPPPASHRVSPCSLASSIISVPIVLACSRLSAVALPCRLRARPAPLAHLARKVQWHEHVVVEGSGGVIVATEKDTRCPHIASTHGRVEGRIAALGRDTQVRATPAGEADKRGGIEM